MILLFDKKDKIVPNMYKYVIAYDIDYEEYLELVKYYGNEQLVFSALYNTNIVIYRKVMQVCCITFCFE